MESPSTNPPCPTPVGLLVSQIGYELDRSKQALVRGPVDLLRAGVSFRILNARGECVLEKPWMPWGSLWGSYWWRGDFSELNAAGEYTLDAGPSLKTETIEIGPNLLWERTHLWVGIEQAERRARLAMNGVGWQDCGAQWQEANSHAAYILGFCDLLERASVHLSDDHAHRAVLQIINGCDYLGLLQDHADSIGLGLGAVSHQKPRFAETCLHSDVAKAAAAWSRTARLLPGTFGQKRLEYTRRAQIALEWLRRSLPPEYVGFSRANHGAPRDYHPPREWMTRDLLMQLCAMLDLCQLGNTSYEAEAVALARRVMARQIPQSEALDGLYGHFRTFDSTLLTEKAWTHHLDSGVVGPDAGAHVPHDLSPLIRMCSLWPHHVDAPRWRKTVTDFAYGYLLPACHSSPFLILPLGHFPKEGILHFAGLWHGMNAAYASIAALARDFSSFLNNPVFEDIATGNLQWIAGLNAGVTAASLAGSHMFSMQVPANSAYPVSMICGIGRRWAGTWLNVRGAICNGYSAGDQFRFDVEPTIANDGPFMFTDEDWVTHAGAWLSAISRRAPSSLVQPPSSPATQSDAAVVQCN